MGQEVILMGTHKRTLRTFQYFLPRPSTVHLPEVRGNVRFLSGRVLAHATLVGLLSSVRHLVGSKA